MNTKWQWTLVCGLGLLVGLAYAQDQPAAENPATTNLPNGSAQPAQNAENSTKKTDKGWQIVDQVAEPAPGTQENQGAQGNQGIRMEGGKLTTQRQKVSYGIGMQLGVNLRRTLEQGGVEVDAGVVGRAVMDALAGNQPPISQQELAAAMTQFQQDMQDKQQQMQTQLEAEGRKNRQTGEEFLAANKEKEGIQTLESGLQYRVLEEGDGPTPDLSDTVTFHFKGTFIDGSVFGDSRVRGEAVTHPLNDLIPGWKQALQMMNVGSKWQLFVPSDLGYGPQGRPPTIGPNQTLIFEVELLGIRG